MFIIKNGELRYDEIMQMADKLLTEIEQADPFSTLADEPNQQAAIAALVSMRETLYR